MDLDRTRSDGQGRQDSVNPRGPADDDSRDRMVPDSDVAPADPEARATSQNAGSPGTQAAEYLVGDEPGDQELPPAVPKVARDAGVRPASEDGV